MSFEQAAKKRRTEDAEGTLDVKPQTKYEYISGYGGEIKSEAKEGAIPEMYNTPQVCPLGLYAEQINGTAFTKPRDGNRRTWVYKIRPSAVHDEMVKEEGFALTKSTDLADPRQRRWHPFPLAEAKTTFVQSLTPYAGAGDPSIKAGVRIYLYSFNTPMGDSCFYNSDGDFLFVAETGELDIITELGRLQVRSGEICVIPRGLKFQVNNVSPNCRGYVCEVFDGHFKIPDLGPIGANGLANPRDFLAPTAWYEDRVCAYKTFNKFGGDLWSYKADRSPFDVVGWHGNYVPVKYDLARFCAVNSVTFDHLDPSIFTVLTCQTADPGTAAMDFVIFPPRYMVQMNTFRPPYYHRNCMSEFMGNICGAYEAKEKGFQPGGATLHSCMTGHGPDAGGFEKASKLDTMEVQRPSKTDLAFMFETTYMLKLSDFAYNNLKDEEYIKCWHGLKSHFKA
eukprot:TRINITY_DN46774_c0_g1_i1.p1 TRINITY_DN46774_c0_g1~~TRINITY_DN46774_c0_g1_i1.p1  ORF type:complete len:451 (+),score=178.64 TRINITY_DN46774_c0_g1_i1:67-1419(+)